MNRRFVLSLLSALVVLAACGCRGPAGSGGWRWEKETGSSLALVGPGGPLWQFHYAADGDHVYFHPLRTTDGLLMTWDRPPDHLWHHGLWFSWKYINKVNYWEIDPKTGHPAGRTSWTNVRVSTGKDLEARIEMDLDYRPVGESRPGPDREEDDRGLPAG